VAAQNIHSRDGLRRGGRAITLLNVLNDEQRTSSSSPQAKGYSGPSSKPLLDMVTANENDPHNAELLTKRLKSLEIDELKQLSEELRWEVLESVSKTGGHLGSSLGVIELTVALHHVFDTPTDRIIWDVAHQCYPHKILTGRRSRMHTIRQQGGISGFCKRKEVSFFRPAITTAPPDANINAKKKCQFSL